ncbi:MAG: lipocalin-like domain-containing protein [Burkholderiales bacterium]
MASLAMTAPAVAGDGIAAGDPMVRITAPPSLRVDKAAVLDRLGRDVSRDTGLDRSLLTYYWQTFDAINSMGEAVDNRPLFVDLYVPGFMTDATVGKVMRAIASSLAQQTGVDRKWVFVHTHTAEQGRVLLSGDVQYFDRRDDKPAANTGPSRDPLVGTWKLVAMDSRDEATGAQRAPWGSRPLGFLTYTAGGRMSAVLAAPDRTVTGTSAGESPDDEQARLFRDSFAYAGTYTVSGDGVVHHVEVASDPTWIGHDQVRTVRLTGSRLVVSAPPIRTAANPSPRAMVLTWERIE